MNKQLAQGIAFIGMLAFGPALAADMAVKAPLPPAPAAGNWSGFYIGANGGYAWDPSTVFFDPGVFATTVLAPGFVVASSSRPFALSVHPQGALGGGHVGYNWQAGVWVYGFEADFDGANIKGSAAAPFSVVGTNFGDAANITGNLGLTQKIDYFGTARGRFGWADNAALFYVTGGVGWAHVKTTVNTFGITSFGLTPAQAAALLVSASSSDVRAGLALGAGVEWAIAQNLSLRAEYLFIDLASGGSLTIPGGSASFNYLPVQVARVGLSFLFH